MGSILDFMRLFKYDRDKSFNIGVERERFVLGGNDIIHPGAYSVLQKLPSDNRFGYELSACQLEDRVGPCSLADLEGLLVINDLEIERVTNELGLRYKFYEVAPIDMPLDVYPDPTGRYQSITSNMSKDILRAACRIAGTHVHIGMPDAMSALYIYNYVIKFVDELSSLGDGSDGERLKIYRIMAPVCNPREFASWDELYKNAIALGFDADPRKCWTLIRLSVHGTIEFRMFGASSDVRVIKSWANRCLEICLQGYARYGSNLSDRHSYL